MKKKILAIILVIVMCFSTMPMTVFAENIASGTGWYLSDDGCLHINGAVNNKSAGDNSLKAPWYDFREQISSIVAENGASVNNCYRLFYDCSYATSVDLSKLDTSNVTDMGGMFEKCVWLTSIDLSSLNTAKVTDMSYMFYNCNNLVNLDVTNFNTSNVTDMSFMFANCKKVTSINLTGFNTSNVTSMNSMFSHCESLTSLDLSSFNTAKVTNMSWMFYECKNLVNLDVTSFNTAKVTNMSFMFSFCNNLLTLDVTSFNTSNAIKMNNIFTGCKSLIALDVSGFDTSKAEKIEFMFSSCSNLTKIDISNFSMESTKEYADRYYIFQNCESLVEVTIKHDFLFEHARTLLGLYPEWKNKETGEVYTSEYELGHVPGKVTIFRDSIVPDLNGWSFEGDGCLHITGAVNNQSTESMDYTPWKAYKKHIKTVITEPGASVNNCNFLFSGCENLTSAQLDNLDTSNATSMKKMFYECKGLVRLDLSGINTSNVTDMSDMFFECNHLQVLDISSFNTSKVTYMKRMFCNCNLLYSFDISGFDTSQVRDMMGMFLGCWNIKSLDLSHFNVENNYDFSKMFSNCISLRTLDISSFNWESINPNYTLEMFLGCEKLSNLKANDTEFPLIAEQLIELSTEWVNKDSGVAYPDVTSLQNIETVDGCATITRVATIMSSSSWHLDGDGTLYLTGEVPDYVHKGNSAPQEGAWSLVVARETIESVIAEPGSSTLNYEYMFSRCYDLVSVDLLDLDISNLTSADKMFYCCHKLSQISAKPELISAVANDLITISPLWKDQIDGTLYMSEDDIKSISRPTTLIRLNTIASGEGWILCDDGTLYIDGEVTNNSALASDETPWRSYKNQITSVVTLPGAKVNNGAFLFAYCSNLAEADLSELDTFDVTSMRSMFQDCSSLTSLDLSYFETMNVANMAFMFNGCSSLEELNVKHLNTANVTNFNYMFNDCSSLTSLDVRGFITSNAQYMANMFAGCSSLESLDLYSFDTSNVTSMNGMFNGCSSVYILDLSGFDFSKVTYANDMFTGCSSLNELDINGDIIKKVASQLMSISLSWFNATDGLTYSDEESLKTITGNAVLATIGIVDSGDGWALDELGNLFITGAVSNPSGTTDNVPWKDYRNDIKTVTAKPGASIDNGRLLFYNCANLKTANLTELDISGALSIVNMFYKCPSLIKLSANPAIFSATATQLIAIAPDWVNTTTGTVYSSANDLKAITSNATIEKVARGDGWYLDTAGVLHITGSVSNPSVHEDETPWKDSKNKIVSVVTQTGASLDKADYLFMNCPNLVTVDLSKLNTSTVRTFYYTFTNCPKLKTVNFGSINTSNVLTMESMFQNCSSLTSIDLSRINTSKVWNYISMFDGCSSLKSADLGDNFVTSSATYLGNMFNGCSSLEEIDVSSFDTSNVTSMVNMFNGCSSLTNLDLSDWDVSKVTVNSSYNYMLGIIEGCTSLETFGANHDLLNKMADDIIAIHRAWANEATGTVYTTASGLKSLQGKVYLIRTILMGDVDLNGVINSSDYAMLLSYVQCDISLNDEQKLASDFNGDTAIDAFDVIVLDLYLNGVCDIEGNYL